MCINLPRCLPSLAWLVALGALLVPDASHAAWQPDGTQICVQPCYPIIPLATSDGAGGAFAVWGDERNALVTNGDIYVQRVLSNGNLAFGWPAAGLGVALGPTAQGLRGCLADGLGSMIVPWRDSRNWAVYAKKITGMGASAAGWPDTGIVVRDSLSASVYVSADGFGGLYLLAGSEPLNSPPSQLHLHRVSGDGSLPAGWMREGMQLTSVYSSGHTVALKPDGAGGAYASWAEGNAGTGGVRLQHVLANGTIAANWPAQGVLVTGEQAFPWDLWPDDAGGIYVLRSSGIEAGSGTVDDLRLHRFGSDATVAPGWPATGVSVCSAARPQTQALLESDGAGGVMAAWWDFRSSARDEIYAQRVLASGALAPGWPVDGLAVSTSPGYQSYAGMASDGAGGIYVAWTNSYQGQYIYAQHLTASGTPAAGWPTDGWRLSGPGSDYPDIVADGTGGAIVVWEQSNLDSAWLCAQKLVTDGTVAVAVALVSVRAEPGRVTLRWHASEGNGAAAVIERREAEGAAWRERARTSVSGAGLVEYEDTDVRAGRAYEYRAGVFEGGVATYGEAVRVEVPLTAPLALRGFAPNPSGARASVAFTLTGGEPARLALYDVAGREVFEREVGSLGAGAHVIGLDAVLASGLYWIRLTQGEQRLERRGIVVR